MHKYTFFFFFESSFYFWRTILCNQSQLTIFLLNRLIIDYLIAPPLSAQCHIACNIKAPLHRHSLSQFIFLIYWHALQAIAEQRKLMDWKHFFVCNEKIFIELCDFDINLTKEYCIITVEYSLCMENWNCFEQIMR